MANDTEVLTFTCTVITPSRTVVTVNTVTNAVFLAIDGEYTVQPRHEPVLVPLRIGLLKLTELQANGETKEVSVAVNGGFLDMDGEVANVFAYSAEIGTEVDLARAKEAEKRARERLEQIKQTQSSDSMNIERARRALFRALNRQKLVGGI